MLVQRPILVICRLAITLQTVELEAVFILQKIVLSLLMVVKLISAVMLLVNVRFLIEALVRQLTVLMVNGPLGLSALSLVEMEPKLELDPLIRPRPMEVLSVPILIPIDKLVMLVVVQSIVF